MPTSVSAGGDRAGDGCADARSIVQCAKGGVGRGSIANVRSTSAASTGASNGARIRANTVASPSSSMLDDDVARLERTRARVFSAGVDSAIAE
jgi:hypothetical protein